MINKKIIVSIFGSFYKLLWSFFILQQKFNQQPPFGDLFHKMHKSKLSALIRIRKDQQPSKKELSADLTLNIKLFDFEDGFI